MDFFELVHQRRSIRKFQPQPIPEKALQTIYEVFNSAPSAGNVQAYEVFVVENKEKLKQLARAALGQDCISEAPVALVFCADPTRSAHEYGTRGENLYAVQDATIACTYAHLAAAALGLGSVWVGAFHDNEVWKAIGSPKGLRPVAILPVGYPAETPEPTPRRKLEDLVHKI